MGKELTTNNTMACPYCGKAADKKHIFQCEKKSPLISVVIPSRAGEEIKTLPSLKNQTYKNIEIIIEYDIKQEGVSVTRNRGAKKAKGKYLFFCDNDLNLYSTCISDLYLTLKSDPKAKWCFGKFIIEGEGVYNEDKNLEVPKNEKSVEFIEWFRGISTMSLIDASINSVFDENMKKFTDWDLWLTIYKKGHKPVFCDKILFRTSFSKGGVSLKNDARFWQDKLYIKHGIFSEEEALLKRIAEINKFENILEEKERIIPKKDEIISELTESVRQEEQEIQRKNREIQEKSEQIDKLNAKINQKNEQIKKVNDEIQKRDQEIANISFEIQKRDQEIQLRDQEINFIKSSKFWKARELYLRAKSFRFAHLFELSEKGMIALKKEGTRKFFWYLYKYLIHGRKYFRKKGELVITSDLNEYEAWIQKNENIDENKILEEINSFSKNPKISVVMIVSDADEIFLREAVFSVIGQYYQNWELRVIGNAVDKLIIKKILEQFEKKDARIKVDFLEKREEFSEATNRAVETAKGEFVAFIGQNDVLEPDAFFEAARSINNIPDSDVIYSDEDKINEDEIRFDYNFKPDWSPELVISQGYIGNLLLVSKEIFRRIGGFRSGFKGAEAYDFSLRLLEITEKAVHIQKILFHERVFPWQEKIFSNIENGRLALESSLKRRMIKGKAKIPSFALEKNIMNYGVEFKPEDYSEKVTIIIPTKDQVDLLEKCIRSIKEKTNYRNYEILVIDNNSKERKTFDFLKQEKINYVSIPTKGFNYSRIHNLAVKEVKSELILLLNNDTEVISPEWLTVMVGTMLMDTRIGAVGARLVYGDKKIQHGGVIVGPHSTADHANKNLHFEDGGYQNYNLVMKNYSAVTAACMLTKKSLFEKVGGLNEKDMAVAFNDVDFCLKLIKSGYRIVYNPDALLYHHESKSRGNNHNLEEPRYFTSKWKKIVEQDPYGNPNLSLENGRFILKNK